MKRPYINQFDREFIRMFPDSRYTKEILSYFEAAKALKVIKIEIYKSLALKKITRILAKLLNKVIK